MSSLNIAALKARLNELSNKTKMSDVLWKPAEGKTVIRIVPFAKDPTNPFIEAYFHYLGGKTYPSPMSIGDPDPIAEFADSLRGAGGLSKEEWAETKKFVPKPRTYVPIVVRGKESEGTKLWGFGKTTYQELLAIMSDPDYGDITDIKTGRNINVEFTPGEKSDTKFPKTKILVSPKETPLTDDKELLNTLLTVQPNLFDIYKIPSYDELKDVLTKFLAPAANSSSSESSDEFLEDPATMTSPTAKKSAETKVAAAKSTKQVDEEFDKLFNDN
jgi:hypothetical protein